MSNARNIASIAGEDVLNASNEIVPVYACRAWVNFNSTGTVAIRDSGNVSSITDNGTGNYTVNFTTAMPDVNYGVAPNCAQLASQTVPGGAVDNCFTGEQTTSGFRIFTLNGSTSLDFEIVEAAVFR